MADLYKSIEDPKELEKHLRKILSPSECSDFMKANKTLIKRTVLNYKGAREQLLKKIEIVVNSPSCC